MCFMAKPLFDIVNKKLDVKCLSSDGMYVFFGYYNLSSFGRKDTKVLAHRIDSLKKLAILLKLVKAMHGVGSKEAGYKGFLKTVKKNLLKFIYYNSTKEGETAFIYKNRCFFEADN